MFRFARSLTLALFSAAASVTGAAAATSPSAPPAVRFDSSWKSLEQYRCPEWFRDAKFGIWTCWNPYTVPAIGDWYARDMYVEGSRAYKYHVANYGHPSKVGYKDIIEMWKGEKFDPEKLVALFKEAGAKYIVAMAAHHDNFDLWNSTHHEWNSVNHGPRQNIIGKWERAVRNAGLRWGVTSHLERAWNWLGTSKNADKKGPLAGVPYDGADPKNAGLYFPNYAGYRDDDMHYAVNPPPPVIVDYARRIKDLLDQHKPDLFYFDGGVPFGETGRRLLAYYYNANTAWHGGKLEAVMCIKNYNNGRYHGDGLRNGIGVPDLERGQMASISDVPWQTDDSIGDWFWTRNDRYKTTREMVDLLVDVVSKNGSLLINVPPRADGTLDERAITLLKEIGAWLRINGEGIYGTRPHTIFGEGPTVQRGGYFTARAPLTAKDIRFTTKGDTVFAFVFGAKTTTPPELRTVTIRNFAARNYHKVAKVELLGTAGELQFTQAPDALHITLPATLPCDHAICLKITPQPPPVPADLPSGL